MADGARSRAYSGFPCASKLSRQLIPNESRGGRSGLAREEAWPPIGQFGGRYLLRGPGAQLLEGDFGNGGSVVISEWPDREAALAFWNSSKYAEAKQLRDGLANVQVLLIEAPKIEA